MAKKEQTIEEVVDTKPQKTPVEEKATDDKIKVKNPSIKKIFFTDADPTLVKTKLFFTVADPTPVLFSSFFG